MLAIEIDGSSHLKKKGSDVGRDEYLLQRGVTTIRYNNEDILKRPEKVIMELKDLILRRQKELSLSSKGECPTGGRTRGI